MKPKYSIIIPTKNEEDTIAHVLYNIPNEIKKNSEIIVADSSDDLTPFIAKSFGAMVIKVKSGGKGKAVRIGVEKSRGDTLIFLDGDGTDPPTYIPHLLKKLEDCHLVLGCRDENKTKDKLDKMLFLIYKFGFVSPFLRKFNKLGLTVSDPLAGFRAIRKSDFNKLGLQSNNFELETEMNIKALNLGFKIGIVQIPVTLRENSIFKSKLLLNPKELIKIIKLSS